MHAFYGVDYKKTRIINKVKNSTTKLLFQPNAWAYINYLKSSTPHFRGEKVTDKGVPNALK